MQGHKMARKESASKKSFTIHDLDPKDRLRERLVQLGAEDLAAQELLAILLGRGIAGESVMVTAQRLLNHFDSLYQMSEASVEQLMLVKGIGLAKACQIKAAFQLGKRMGFGKVVGLGEAV